MPITWHLQQKPTAVLAIRIVPGVAALLRLGESAGVPFDPHATGRGIATHHGIRVLRDVRERFVGRPARGAIHGPDTRAALPDMRSVRTAESGQLLRGMAQPQRFLHLLGRHDVRLGR